MISKRCSHNYICKIFKKVFVGTPRWKRLKMENKIEKTPANNYDNNIFDKKEKNSICISTEDNIKGSHRNQLSQRPYKRG